MSSHLSKLASLSAARTAVAGVPASAQSQRMAALRATWAAHTIKRALAAVNSASDEDYRAFGWERCELIAKLQWLRDEIERPHADRRIAMAITVSRPTRAQRQPVEA